MYSLFTNFERIIKGFRIILKMSYYKLKYGKRLKIGKNFRFRKALIINISKDGRLTIGNNCFFNNYCSINCHKKISIGDNNIFGENVKIYDHNHVFNDKNKDMRTSYKSNQITIGNNNWFGSNSVILSKTSIGNNNVFSANTTINQQFTDNSLIKMQHNITIEAIRFKSQKEGQNDEAL